MNSHLSENIIFYDGVCMLCDGLVQYIIKKDNSRKFVFCQLQSNKAIELLKPFGLEPKKLDTMYLLHNSTIYEKSSAVIKIAEMLPNNILKIFLIGKILPKIFNDFIYNVVSKVRYKLYGKKEKCDIPSTSTRDRFLL